MIIKKQTKNNNRIKNKNKKNKLTYKSYKSYKSVN